MSCRCTKSKIGKGRGRKFRNFFPSLLKSNFSDTNKCKNPQTYCTYPYFTTVSPSLMATDLSSCSPSLANPGNSTMKLQSRAVHRRLRKTNIVFCFTVTQMVNAKTSYCQNRLLQCISTDYKIFYSYQCHVCKMSQFMVMQTQYVVYILVSTMSQSRFDNYDPHCVSTLLCFMS